MTALNKLGMACAAALAMVFSIACGPPQGGPDGGDKNGDGGNPDAVYTATATLPDGFTAASFLVAANGFGLEKITDCLADQGCGVTFAADQSPCTNAATCTIRTTGATALTVQPDPDGTVRASDGDNYVFAPKSCATAVTPPVVTWSLTATGEIGVQVGVCSEDKADRSCRVEYDVQETGEPRYMETMVVDGHVALTGGSWAGASMPFEDHAFDGNDPGGATYHGTVSSSIDVISYHETDSDTTSVDVALIRHGG